jgi:hypothetical protein
MYLSVFSAVCRCRAAADGARSLKKFVERKGRIRLLLLQGPHFNFSSSLFFLFSPSLLWGYVAPLAWRWFVWLGLTGGGSVCADGFLFFFFFSCPYLFYSSFLFTSSACASLFFLSFVILLSATTHLTGGPYISHRVSFPCSPPLSLFSLRPPQSPAQHTLHAREEEEEDAGPNKHTHTKHNRGPYCHP